MKELLVGFISRLSWAWSPQFMVPSSCTWFQDTVPHGLMDKWPLFFRLLSISSLQFLAKWASPIQQPLSSKGTSQEDNKKLTTGKMEVIIYCNLITKVTWYLLCHILLVRIKSQGLTHVQGEGITQMWIWTPGGRNHLRKPIT